MSRLRWIVIGVLFSFALQAEAKHFIHIQEDASADQKTAVLILNGFGGTKKGCQAQMAFWADRGMDVFIPDVLLRSSLKESSDALEAFVEAQHLEDYREVKAICYIAGAYLLHTQLETHPMANLTRIVYDRSPTQERAPQTAMARIPKLGMLKLGKVLRDLSVATWPDVPESDQLKKGLAIENRATPLMRFLQEEAEAMGPLVYDWQAIDPTAHDAFHVALDHDMMYVRWDVLGEPFLHFFEHGVFPADLPRDRIHDRPFDPSYPLPE